MTKKDKFTPDYNDFSDTTDVVLQYKEVVKAKPKPQKKDYHHLHLHIPLSEWEKFEVLAKTTGSVSKCINDFIKKYNAERQDLLKQIMKSQKED